jgi:hypothetical protein
MSIRKKKNLLSDVIEELRTEETENERKGKKKIRITKNHHQRSRRMLRARIIKDYTEIIEDVPLLRSPITRVPVRVDTDKTKSKNTRIQKNDKIIFKCNKNMAQKSIIFVYCGDEDGPDWKATYRLLNIPPIMYVPVEITAKNVAPWDEYYNYNPQYLNRRYIAVRNVTSQMRQILTDNRLLYLENGEVRGLEVFTPREVKGALMGLGMYFDGSMISHQYICGKKETNAYKCRYEDPINMYKILLTEYLLFTSGLTELIDLIINSSIRQLLLFESIQDIVIDYISIDNLLQCLPNDWL